MTSLGLPKTDAFLRFKALLGNLLLVTMQTSALSNSNRKLGHQRPSNGRRPHLRRHTKVMAAVEEVLKQGAGSTNPEVPTGLNKFSSRITQPKAQGASQAMLYGTGLTPEDMSKPQVSAYLYARLVTYFEFIF